MPIINPWMIYIIDTIDSLKGFLKFLTLVSMFVLAALALISLDDSDSAKPLGKRMKHLAIFTLVCFIVTVIVSSSATLTKMVIAKNVTYERVDMAQDIVKQVYNDILNVVKQDKED